MKFKGFVVNKLLERIHQAIYIPLGSAKLRLNQRSVRAASNLCPNTWEPLGGGCNDNDETILHAAARKLREEAGLEAARVIKHVSNPYKFTTGSSEAKSQKGSTFRLGYRRRGHSEKCKQRELNFMNAYAERTVLLNLTSIARMDSHLTTKQADELIALGVPELTFDYGDAVRMTPAEHNAVVEKAAKAGAAAIYDDLLKKQRPSERTGLGEFILPI
ncbi:hypothetical protein O1611_g3866 [Lasiodiplodia mahajangana]|uniref:Uncharacterized protein n=1 Tax=Lasiodiplodia mahajangana TaxID=1108764 RepID=A0ACC2JQX1_9PEZI|nr:hypothetical protein O1611_g3866 [Lasiodiplodia mahajangana]